MTDDPPEGPDFAELYDRNFAKVYNYVRCRVLDRAAADDVTSRVFEKALDRLESFDPRRGPAAAWLFGIAANAVTDHFRAKALLSWLPLEAFTERRGAGPAAEGPLLEAESLRGLLGAMAGLDARERELLGLKFGAGMTNRAIAAQLDLSESNVGVILFRAIKKLQAALKENP